MKLYNTLARSLEEFVPADGKTVRFYSCGPTVYDTAHIGNLRTYLFNDTLKRVLLANDFVVKHVMNITDVDDKTIKRSEGKRREFEKLTREYERLFFEDLEALNILPPDEVTRATAYIDKMVDFICDLLELGYAYKSEDGSVYFSIEKFKDYGKLSHLDREGIKAGARVNQDEYDKNNPSDFALWKAWDEQDGEIYWNTKLGQGRPGWHIECSAMASDRLGDTIDIHTGGVDNIFPHHENEIAQSEARSGKQFVRFWVHGEHLLVDNQKMAKSAGNFYKLADVVGKGYSPLDFRYLVLGAHYRSKLNFTWEGLEAAKNARMRLNRLYQDFGKSVMGGGGVIAEYYTPFKEKVSNDLDLPAALAILWEMMRDEGMAPEDKAATLKKMDEVLGLKIGEAEKVEVPEEILELARMREQARAEKNFELADEKRRLIEEAGWAVKDLPEGFDLEKK